MRIPPEDESQDPDGRQIQTEAQAGLTTRGEEPARQARSEQRERVEQAGNAEILRGMP